jgi:hypothetical protein
MRDDHLPRTVSLCSTRLVFSVLIYGVSSTEEVSVPLCRNLNRSIHTLLTGCPSFNAALNFHPRAASIATRAK